MPEPITADAPTLLAALEAEHQRLRSMLAGREPAKLGERPPTGKWSVVENVRHLLFAEELHLGRFVPGEREWSPLGLPPHGMQTPQRLRIFDVNATPDLDDVLEAWRIAHARIRPHLVEDGEFLRRELFEHTRHLRAHVRVIERLLR
jgi:hypothetical protein